MVALLIKVIENYGLPQDWNDPPCKAKVIKIVLL